jgi:hypothetical protein
MTTMELILLGLVISYQIVVFVLLGLQQEINKTVKDAIDILLKEQSNG